MAVGHALKGNGDGTAARTSEFQMANSPTLPRGDTNNPDGGDVQSSICI
jgi:hypothetical protein